MIRRALKPSLRWADAAAALVGVLGAALLFFDPSLVPIIGLGFWVIPIAAFVFVFAFRLISSPYEIYKEEVNKRSEVERQLNTISAPTGRLLLAQVKRAQLYRSSPFIDEKREIYEVVQAWFKIVIPAVARNTSLLNLSARIEFWDAETSAMKFSVHGQWAMSTAPDHVGFSGSSDTVNIQPGHIRAKLLVALKYKRDTLGYAYSKESFLKDPDGRDPSREISQGWHSVRVVIAGMGVDQQFWFRLENRGTGSPLELIPIDEDFAKQVSHRLHRSLELVNESRTTRAPLDIANVAELLGLDRPNQLRDYFDGKEEPDFSFLERFASLFGMYKEWLKFGEGTPFKTSETCESLPTRYYQRIMEAKPSKTIIVRSDTEDGEANILLSLTDLRFAVMCGDRNSLPHASRHVGDGGAAALLDIYLLVRRLKKEGYRHKMIGYILDEGTFRRVTLGNAYPGMVLGGNYSVWWHDLLDIDRSEAMPDYYRRAHGQWMVDVLDIIRPMVRRLPEDFDF